MSYLCNLAPCTASFSTLSDWRFHALLTHSNLETLWICPEDLHPTTIGKCHAAYRRARDLRAHMRKIHNLRMHNDDTIANLAVGIDRQRFWCGFCRAAVGVVREGELAWRTARTEHVQAHFLCWNGVCANNDLWVDVGVREAGE